MKNNIFIDIKDFWILIENFNLFSNEVQKILIREKKLEEFGTNFVKKYQKTKDVCNFYEIIKNYCERQNLSIMISSTVQNIIDKEEKKEQEKNEKFIIAKEIGNLVINQTEKTKKEFDWKNFKTSFSNFFSLPIVKKHLSTFESVFKIIQNKMIKDKTPYLLQLKNIYHNLFLNSSCNFSVPGSGKTLIGLIIFLFLKTEKQVQKLLIIAPLSSYMSWEDEYLNSIKDASGDDFQKLNELNVDKRKFSLFDNRISIYIINYEKLYQSKEILIDFLKENDVFLIFDEAHKIKNANSSRTLASLEIAKHSHKTLILTGTPMPKGYEDLKSYFSIIEKSSFDTKPIIIESTKRLKDFTKKTDLHEDDIDNLSNKIKSYYCRITKKDLDLKTPSTIYWEDFDNDLEHKNIYRIIEEKLINKLKNWEDKKKLSELLKAKIFRLMQASVDPRMILKSSDYSKEMDKDEEYNDVDSENKEISEEKKVNEILKNYPYTLIKNENFKYSLQPKRYKYCFKQVKKLFETEGIKKIIIWSCWIYVIEELKKLFSSQSYKTECIYGKTDFTTREKHLRDFQTKKGLIQVLICNPASVSESVSLHQYCHDAVYFDMTWNALYFMQSKERIHRFSKKTKKVNYYILRNPQWIDGKIWENIHQKEEKMLNVVESKNLVVIPTEEDEGLIQKLSKFYKKKEY